MVGGRASKRVTIYLGFLAGRTRLQKMYMSSGFVMSMGSWLGSGVGGSGQSFEL